MGIGTILIGLALLTVITVLIISPILEPYRPALESPSRRQELEVERETIIRSIRELDLDFRTHKLNEDDYKSLREAQVQHGAALLRELDQLAADDTDDNIDAQIESKVAALRSQVPTCPSCTVPLRKGDRFCANCGCSIDNSEKNTIKTGNL